MANEIKLKKWNGSAWVQQYPEVRHTDIVTSGTPSSSTFLRGDGQWATVEDSGNQFVNISGDTMTGNLSIENGGPNLTLKDTTDSDDIAIYFKNTSNSTVGQFTTTGNRLNIITNFSNGLSIDAAKVGIGTTSPAQKLEVNGITRVYQGSQTALKTYSGQAGLQLVGYQSTSGSPYTKTSDIVANADGTVASQMRLFTKASGDSSASERMRITDAGNVGIGTTSPAEKLEVAGKVRASGNFEKKGSGGYYLYNSSMGFRAALYDNGSVTSIYGDGNGSTPVININSDSVGIGIASPTQALDVVGNIKASSNMYAARYYDLNNTSYYVDPTSTSILYNIDVQNIFTTRGDFILDANNNNEKLYISRYGQTTQEFTSFSRDDTITHIHTKNDEESSTVRFRIENTDTETGGGADANDRNIDFISDATDARIVIDGNRVATESYVDTEIASLVASAPSTLDTLNELAAALGDDANFATTMTNALAGKLSTTGKAADSELLDGINSTSFLRSDTADTAAGDITFSGNIVADLRIKLNSPSNNIAPLNIKSDAEAQAIHIEETGAGTESWQIGVNGDGDLNFYNSGASTPTIQFYDSNSVFFPENVTMKNLQMTSNGSRTKIRVWSGSTYGMGMTSGFTYGGLGATGGEYAMTFQMNDDTDRGFWWGHSVHSTAQGAMALTTDGELTVANAIRVGYGEADTTTPADNVFDINGNVTIAKTTTGGQNQIKFQEAGTTKTQITSNYGDDKFYLYHEGDNVMTIDSSSVTTFSGDVNVDNLKTNKTSYGEPNTESFYRIKIQDQGGTHNDIGIGQSSSGNLGYNVTAGESHIFYEGTNGEIARLQPSGLALNHNGTGTVESKSITFTSQTSNTDVVRVLKTTSGGNLDFNAGAISLNGNGNITAKGNLYLNNDNTNTDTFVYFGDSGSDTDHYVSFDTSEQKFNFSNDILVNGSAIGGGGVTSIKNFTNYVASNGTTARQLALTKSLSVGDKIGLVVQSGSTSNYGTRSQEIIWVEVGTSSHTVQSSYYSTATTTARWYAFEVYITSAGALYIDDAVAWTNGSFGHSGSNSSAIYILDVLELA